MRFRKKPVEVFAWQWTNALQPFIDAPRWVKDDPRIKFSKAAGGPGLVGRMFIDTLEGTMSADLQDWLIRGVKGEIYPCKPDIFAATYEPVEP